MKQRLMVCMIGFAIGLFGPLLIAWNSPDGSAPYFHGSARTNSMTWDGNLAPVIVYQGTTYTGISSNRQFLGGTGVTNTMQIVNGQIVGIQ